MIKKYQIIIILCAFVSISGYAQQGNFFKTYTGTDDIDFFHVDTVHDGGYILSGSSYGLTGGDFIVLKTDSLGNEEWRFVNNDFNNNTYDNTGRIVRETIDHCFIVTGKIQVSPTNYFDIKIAKIDSIGNLMWSRNYDFSNNDQPWELVLERDSNFYVFGRIDNNIAAIKFNFNGDTLFTKNIGNAGCLNNIEKVIRDGSFFILAGKAAQGTLGNKLIVQKLDSLCNPVWCNSYSDTFNLNNFGDIYKLSNNNFATIATYSTANILYSLNIKILGSMGSLQGNQIINSNISGVFMSDSVFASGVGVATHNPDSAALGTFNINNTSINRYNVFYAPNILGRRILVDRQGAIVSAGKMDNGNSSNGYLMKAKRPNTLSVAKISKPIDSYISVFVDALSRQVIFKLSDSFYSEISKYDITIIDSKGQEVKSIHNQNSKQTSILLTNLQSGIYFFNLIDKKQINRISGKFIFN